VSEVVLALQGRLTVASDLPMLSSFFFQQPDLETPEAYRMRSTVDDATYGAYPVLYLPSIRSRSAQPRR
jgi:hypothetical protein